MTVAGIDVPEGPPTDGPGARRVEFNRPFRDADSDRWRGRQFCPETRPGLFH